MISLCACITGFLLDRILGDPQWRFHPIRIIGNLISFWEGKLRKDQEEAAMKRAGAWLVVAVTVPSVLLPLGLLIICQIIHPLLRLLAESFLCYFLFAAKSLKTESMKVHDKLVRGDVEGGRQAVSMIVGRDTQSLTEEGIIKAAVETVAENTSDGVVAPVIYTLLGGAPLGFLYKAINTMDSMVGYKNDKYLYFGRAAAKLDDLVNFIPARISAYLMILSAFLLGEDGKNAFKIYRRDRYRHASPNSAHTEAVCAGALRVQLAGDAWYFGKLYKKEYIGDALTPIQVSMIPRANRLMYITSTLSLIIFAGIRLFLITILYT